MADVKIGVAITTHNRAEITRTTIDKWRGLLPKEAVLVVVDDASDVPYPGADFRFEVNVGIAKAKNKCLEILEDLGVTDYFLADNDCYPKTRDWWKPYVGSAEPHLSYQFLDLVGPVKLHDMREIFRDDTNVAYTSQRGCLLYYKQICLDKVGGFDPIYGRALYEHADLADRIHSAGLTTWRYADVAGSAQIWHSMDEYVQVKRTISSTEVQDLYPTNWATYHERKAQNYQGFVNYRESLRAKRDVILASLLTSSADLQRGTQWAADPDYTVAWLESLERLDLRGAIFADELKKLPRGYSAELIKVSESNDNLYMRRWAYLYQYLRKSPDVRWAWSTDVSDVEVLRDPFKGMVPGKLYVGVENKRVDDAWMRKNFLAPQYKEFFRTHGSKQLLNAGVVGGDRETVMQFAHQMLTFYNDIYAEKLLSKPVIATRSDMLDMGPFNYVGYKFFENRLVTGPEVTTVFKAYEDNGVARFKHK